MLFRWELRQHRIFVGVADSFGEGQYPAWFDALDIDTHRGMAYANQQISTAVRK